MAEFRVSLGSSLLSGVLIVGIMAVTSVVSRPGPAARI
jgi:hypothetical protein